MYKRQFCMCSSAYFIFFVHIPFSPECMLFLSLLWLDFILFLLVLLLQYFPSLTILICFRCLFNFSSNYSLHLPPMFSSSPIVVPFLSLMLTNWFYLSLPFFHFYKSFEFLFYCNKFNFPILLLLPWPSTTRLMVLTISPLRFSTLYFSLCFLLYLSLIHI